MAAFTQAVCWAYCCYVINAENKTDNEKAEYVAEEIQRLSALWLSNIKISSENTKVFEIWKQLWQ